MLWEMQIQLYIIIRHKFEAPAYQTFSSVISVSTFTFVQPGAKNFDLGQVSLSLKVLMKFRGLGTHVAWGKHGKHALRERLELSELLFF